MPKKASSKKTAKKKEESFWSTPLVVAWVGIGLLISIILAGMIVGSLGINSADEASPDLEGLTLVQKVARHVSIPEGEEPTVATVEDADEMRQNNPAFYAEAQNGDQLLVWSNVVVLYSESRDLVLNVLPLDIGSVETIQPENVEVSEEVDEEAMAAELLQKEQELAKIEVRNGTRTPLLARNVSDALELEGFATLRPRDARQKGYEKTLIVKLTDEELPETLRFLKEYLNAEVVELPEVETSVEGDVLIIIGANYEASTE